MLRNPILDEFLHKLCQGLVNLSWFVLPEVKARIDFLIAVVCPMLSVTVKYSLWIRRDKLTSYYISSGTIEPMSMECPIQSMVAAGSFFVLIPSPSITGPPIKGSPTSVVVTYHVLFRNYK